MDIIRWSIPKSDWLYSLQLKMEKLYTVSKNKTRSDYGSDHELLIAKFRLKLKKVGKITRPFSERSESHSVFSDSLQPHGLYSPWNCPGQNIGVGSHYLLQGIFPTQGLNPGFLHSRGILYLLSHQGSPRILECIAYPFFRGHSQPRNWTGVSCIAGGFFTSWATREAHTDIGVCEQHQC